MAAPRLCPRCGTPVDERRARGLPYCLQCGAPLGSGLGMQAAQPVRAGGTSPILWILLGGGIFALLGGIGIILFVVLAASAPPEAPVVATADDGGPVVNLENKDDDAGATAAKPKPK